MSRDPRNKLGQNHVALTHLNLLRSTMGKLGRKKKKMVIATGKKPSVCSLGLGKLEEFNSIIRAHWSLASIMAKKAENLESLQEVDLNFLPCK